jgi:hypothetical protein
MNRVKSDPLLPPLDLDEVLERGSGVGFGLLTVFVICSCLCFCVSATEITGDVRPDSFLHLLLCVGRRNWGAVWLAITDLSPSLPNTIPLCYIKSPPQTTLLLEKGYLISHVLFLFVHIPFGRAKGIWTNDHFKFLSRCTLCVQHS